MFAVLFLAIALPIGIFSGFVNPGLTTLPGLEIAARILATVFFVALPEEILFRGIIQNQLTRRLAKRPQTALAISSLIFGLAHINNSKAPLWVLEISDTFSLSVPWVYVLLASLAGWFYGRLYQRTGSLAAPVLMHALVDITWSLFFRA